MSVGMMMRMMGEVAMARGEGEGGPDDGALALDVAGHGVVCLVCDCEDVWRRRALGCVDVLALVQVRVDGKRLVRIDGHKDVANIGLRGGEGSGGRQFKGQT